MWRISDMWRILDSLLYMAIIPILLQKRHQDRRRKGEVGAVQTAQTMAELIDWKVT